MDECPQPGGGDDHFICHGHLVSKDGREAAGLHNIIHESEPRGRVEIHAEVRYRSRRSARPTTSKKNRERGMDFAEINGVGLRYELSGHGARTLVLVHEMGGSLESWDDVAP